ncbi:phosphate regulon sensor histidine kinase PhoR [Bacterioplanoides pacificum]|uniref:Phosphate regulon sensor protein PhoR n=1 Tax=Bacterioplanoides pacificum TaxID=1171596 RepID=A0ABV7VSF0_9GAMM
MHQSAWQGELTKVGVVTTLGLAAGWTVEQPLYGLLAGLIVAQVMSIRTMGDLFRWSYRQGPAPQDSGLIGYSVDKLIRREKNLKAKLAQQNKQLKRYNQGIESLHDGVVIIDQEGYISNFNGAAARLLSLRQEDMGQHIKNLIRTPRFIKYFDQGSYDDSLQFDTNLVRQQSLQVQITQFGLDQKVMLVRDITERKRVETMRQNFIADVSHELRTPLTVINGYLEMLSDMELPASLSKAVGQMNSQGQRMKSLVNDLIQLSKLESAHSERDGEPVNLKNLGHSVVDQLQEYGDANIHFHCNDELQINGFSDEMSSVLSNLITNAVKYGNGSDVDFRIERQSSGVRVSVTDQGMGIPAEHLARLTERFYRVDDSRESTMGGSGLGLAIVKHALEHHDSVLEIESQPGQGSTFSFVIPNERIR